MNIAGLTLSPPPVGAPTSSPIHTSRSQIVDPARVSPKLALAGFSTLEVSPQPNGAMTSTLSSLSLGGSFTTPTKSGASDAAASLSPISKSTSKKPAPKFASLSLGTDSPTKTKTMTPKASSTAGTPRSKKRVTLNAGISIMSLAQQRSSPRKTPSPKKVSFAEDASFCDVSESTPKPRRGFTPKSSPAKPAVSDVSVMSIVSPTASHVSHNLSPDSTNADAQHELRATSPCPIALSPSKILEAQADQEEDSIFVPSPSKVPEFHSPSKIDTTMHDVTMMSVASCTPFQPYTFVTTELTDAAKQLAGPFNAEMYQDFDFAPSLAAPRIVQKRRRVIRRKKQPKSKRMLFEKAIAEQVVESLAIEELEAATQFRTIASKGKLSYALCPRKRQRATEESDDEDAYWYDADDENGVMTMIEARRVVRNELFDIPVGPSVHELRRQYHEDMQKYGEPLHSVCGKRNYDGAPKRAYNNDLLTHSIMQPLLSFPMPELSFEFVLEEAIREANKARGLEKERPRNVRQPIAMYGEPEISIIEEEEEPQSPTPKLPHFPSTATHQSEAKRKDRLEQGAGNLRAKLAALITVPEPAAISEPLSSPIGPGFTFQVPSFISSPSKSSEAEEAEEGEGAKESEGIPESSEVAASPMVVFKNRNPVEATPESPFKRHARRSLPAGRRLSFSTPLRRASLPVAGSGQLPAVQDLRDPASGLLVGAPAFAVELPAVHNPLEVDLASAAVVQASPAPSAGGTPNGSSSPASVVVDVRENPDIFGSSQDRPGSPIQALASLARVFEEAKEVKDAKVVVSREDGRLSVRFKVSDEHAALFASEQESSIPASPAGSVSSVVSASPVVVATPASPVALSLASPSPSPVAEEKDEEEKDAKAEVEDEIKEQEEHGKEEVLEVPAPAVLDDEADKAMLLAFMSRHAARKAAKAAEAATPVAPSSPSPTPIVAATAPAAPSPLASVPIILAATPERPKGIWADTPTFSTASSSDRSRAGPARSPAISTARQPLGVLDTNSPSPKKMKRKADDVEGPEQSPEKQPPKRVRKAKAEKSGKSEKPEKTEKTEKSEKSEKLEKTEKIEKIEKAEKTEKTEQPKEEEEPAAPTAGVRTRAQRAAERGEAPPATKIPMRHQGYAKMRSGEKDLATVTRQNTRANKGSAIPADQVLAQLKDAPPTVETRAAAAARKDGKSVQWAEKLARSQSEEPPAEVPSSPLSPAEEKQVGKATRAKGKAAGTSTTKKAAATTKTTTKTTTGSAPKTTKLRQPAASSAAAGPKTEGAKVSKPKKVTAAAKKELGLSANGTPAKRSRRIAEKK